MASKGEDEDKSGFLDKVKGFIDAVGEKIEETVGFGKPTADVTGIHIPSINLKKAEIVVDVLVTNPNPIPIPLIDIDYLVESNGRKLVSGTIPDTGTIHAHGSETVKIPVTLIYDDIKEIYDDIKPGQVIPYRVKISLIVDVPIFGRLTLPLEKTGEIPVPYKPEIDLEKIKFNRFSFEETVTTLHLKVENKNDFGLDLNKLDYDFGSAVWDMIRGRGTGYSIKGNLDVDTPFGTMQLPFNREGGTTQLKKTKEDDEVYTV